MKVSISLKKALLTTVNMLFGMATLLLTGNSFAGQYDIDQRTQTRQLVWAFQSAKATLSEPVAVAENHRLFALAEAEKDQSMSADQRIMNNQWLLTRGNFFLEKGSASHIFNAFLSNYWQIAGARPLAKEYDEPALANALADINNYSLKVSEKHVRLKFSYRF